MDAADISEGEAHPVLGPNYFMARRVAEQFMAKFEPDHFKPMVERVAADIHDEMLRNLEAYLLENAENNLQGEIWGQIENCVKAILGGERWAMERYALDERYNCEKVRAAVAKHIPKELQDARISDLEAEVAKLTERLRWHENRA